MAEDKKSTHGVKDAEAKQEYTHCESCDKLQKQLGECMKMRDEYLAGWQRARADYVNFQKAESERVARIAQFANESLLQELLLVLDSFSLARCTLDAKHEGCSRSLELLQSQLEGIVKRYGLEEIQTKVGDMFDPQVHEAIETVEEPNTQSHTIIEIIAKGYRMYGKIIRPVKVKVAK